MFVNGCGNDHGSVRSDHLTEELRFRVSQQERQERRRDALLVIRDRDINL